MLDNRNIEEALSVFEALSNRSKGLEDPLIILHSNKGRTVSLGCFQVTDKDFVLSYLREKGLKHFFRLHGGDVMLHDENQVGIGVILPKDEKYKDVYSSLMSLTLKRSGVTNFQVSDDYVICFNKILGEVMHFEKENLQSWFAVIYLKRDYEQIVRLKSSKGRLFKERVSKIRESCIGLDQVVKKQVSASRFLESIRKLLSDELGFEIQGLRLGLGDKKFFFKTRKMLRENQVSERVRQKYFALSKEEGMLLLSKMLINGFLRMQVKTRDKTIDRVSISGSFVFEPSEKLSEFEKTIEGKELDEAILTEKITEFFINEKVKASFTPFDIVELLSKTTGGVNE